MRLVEIALTNFRGYGSRTVLTVDDLTVLVGKNDAGKSTFLEALNVVLGEGKIDATDIHVRAPAGGELCIECAFSDLPSSLTLDAGSATTLANEYLVDAEGRLRIRWKYSISGEGVDKKLGKQQVRLFARHPSHASVSGLHGRKNPELKKLVTDAGIDAECDLNNNASMRKALWAQAERTTNLELVTLELDLANEGGKSILDQIRAELPMYVLFRADRPSTDQDAEVQDPMKVAVRMALEELRTEVDAMKERVRVNALEVAKRTIVSLREFDVALADSLKPEFADPKLDSAFKLSLLGDDGIAVNKRGSGVRRLVLFSFFRAEAERRHAETTRRGIIYAVEEPETAQHPDFQRRVVNSLQRISELDGCQVLLTTHSPGLAGLLPASSLRLVAARDADRSIRAGDDALNAAVETLGVVPDHRVRVLLCVEGPYDRAFLQAACRAYRAVGEDFVCLTNDPAIAFVLLGGSTLMEWVNANFLRNLRVPQWHLYDNDVHKYGAFVDKVNQRGNGDSARQTKQRELENYLHPDAVRRVLVPHAGSMEPFSFGPSDDVELVVATAMPDADGKPRKRLERRALKQWLNHDVAAVMTVAEFDEQDQIGEIKSWLAEITEIVRGT